MPNQVQLHFSCDVDSEIPWVVSSMTLEEHFNLPYQVDLQLRTDDLTADPSSMLGASATLTIERGDLRRELFGIVGYVHDGADEPDRVLATLTIMPALTALGHRRNSRIFSDLSPKQVLQQVLQDGLSAYGRELDLHFLYADYPVRQHIVQYQESDLDFVHRIMEELGIAYRFEHRDGAELLVLMDSDAGYTPLLSLNNDDGSLSMVQHDGGADAREDLRTFSRKTKIQPTVARGAAFDWRSPGTEPLEAPTDDAASNRGGPELEHYDFDIPSAGLGVDQVERQVRLQARRIRRDAQVFVGSTTATQLSPGTKFEVHDHLNGDLNGHYLVTAVTHKARLPERAYKNTFECVPLLGGWVPKRTTKRPRISGIQTGTVVGPGEIATDSHGRVLVQFHWDRNKAFSTFIPVVQPWAGNGWGTLFIPRVGMQVVISFLDGDPDQPVVTGTLYNGSNAPPYVLDAEKTKTGIKTRSSPGGGGGNELCFDDKAGAEKVFIKAQRDFELISLNDHSQTTHGSQSNTVDKDQAELIQGNQELRVMKNRQVYVQGTSTTHIDEHERRTIKGHMFETIENGVTRVVTGTLDETFNGGCVRNIDGPLVEMVEGDTTYNRVGNRTEMVSGDHNLNVDGSVTIRASGGFNLAAPGGINLINPASIIETFGSLKSITDERHSAVRFSASCTGTSASYTSMAIACTLSQTSITGISVGYTGTVLRNTPLRILQAETDIKTSLVSINSSTLTTIG